jgi:hypothetical protein
VIALPPQTSFTSGQTAAVYFGFVVFSSVISLLLRSFINLLFQGSDASHA